METVSNTFLSGDLLFYLFGDPYIGYEDHG